MTLESQLCLSDMLFTEPKGEPIFAAGGFERTIQCYDDSYSQMVDVHSNHDVRISYLCVNMEDAPKEINISNAVTICHILEDNESGIFLRVNYEGYLYTVWLPPGSGKFCFDKHQRIASSCECHLSYQWEFLPKIKLRVLQHGCNGEVAVIPYVVLKDPNGQFFEELKSLSDVEQRLYRKSDWFFAKTPSDVWNYLINGSLYDPRSDKRIEKRFKCQQCAYAWWSYFNFLHKETHKQVYSLMQDEVAYSVLLDISKKGEWGHGFWADDIETHARFHLDGLHLLISQYEKTGDLIWLGGAERGMDFVSKHLMEELDDDSLWFLHDTIEHNNTQLPHHFKSTIFGKTPGNSLCINTHVQALTVLHRLCFLVPGKKVYAEMFENGVRALRKVLDNQPGELIYRFLMPWIMKHISRKRNNSLKDKVKKIIEGFMIKTIYWRVRHHFPRIVQPSGFIERDLTIAFASHPYHISNLKDLLTLYQQEPLNWLRPYIENGFSYACKFLDELDYTNAIAQSPYYIEFIDILYLYNKLIAPIPSEYIDSVEEKIYQQTRGYSLDYYASELVRGC